MTRSCLTIILAAGEGTRMASSLPKVLHPIAGLAMVNHVQNIAMAAGSTQQAIIVGAQAERVTQMVQSHSATASVFLQSERKGTAHAVLAAREALEQGYDDVVVLCGDAPLIQAENLTLARDVLAQGADIVVLGFEAADPSGYGRMIMEDGNLVAIREHKDASDEEKKITYCNSGIFVFNGSRIIDVLEAIGNDNIQGEFYLPDAVEVGRSKGLIVKSVKVPESETMGVNDRVQLAKAEAIWQQRTRETMMLSGVAMSAPHTVQFSHDTQIGHDSRIDPYVVFDVGVSIGEGVHIRSFSHFEGATIANNAIIGPYARLRPGSRLADGVKIGNFVETKNVEVAAGAKINHLSYVGDSSVGTKANIGAGVITCNYDGVNKHRTTIGAGAFIGTNTSLVAPVVVGDGAMTAAGSIVTRDVPAEAVAIERSEQRNIEGLATKLRQRNEAAKAKRLKST